jgi:cytochrome P450
VTEPVTDTVADNLLLRILLDPETRRDPYPFYRELRGRAPVLRSSIGPLVLSRYHDCLEALRDPRLGRGTWARLRGELPMPRVPAGFDVDLERTRGFFERAGNSMLFADPPDHTRLRQLVSRAFTPQRVERLRPAVQALVNDLLDAMAEAGEVDVIESLAFPLPVTVIGELLGVPPADRAGFQPLVSAGVAALDPTVDSATLERAIALQDQMAGYFAGLVAERRRQPADDLLSGLVAARDEGDALSDDEVIGTAILLFAAGFETTTNLVGNGLLALLRHPDQLQRWRADPDLARSGVEELLRWDSPVQLNARTALVPAEVAGQKLAPGDFVTLLVAGANRDPAKFGDGEVLDVGRSDNAPLSFGSGIHHCLGAALARMEGEVVFNSLLSRFGTIELAVDEPERRPTLVLRALKSLPVRLAA